MIAAVGLNSLYYGTSAKDLAISAAFAVVFAFLGYRISQRYRLIRGVTPWKKIQEIASPTQTTKPNRLTT